MEANGRGNSTVPSGLARRWSSAVPALKRVETPGYFHRSLRDRPFRNFRTELGLARIFQTSAKMASGSSRRRQSALASFPRKSAPTDVGGYGGYETSEIGPLAGFSGPRLS